MTEAGARATLFAHLRGLARKLEEGSEFYAANAVHEAMTIIQRQDRVCSRAADLERQVAGVRKALNIDAGGSPRG